MTQCLLLISNMGGLDESLRRAVLFEVAKLEVTISVNDDILTFNAFAALKPV